jgi:hypothetical protein
MAPTDKRNRDTVLAILQEAKDLGIKTLTRTVLLKFVYLLDFYVAEETSGKKWTDFEWSFLHYGPYSVDLAQCLDLMEGAASIELEQHAKTDKEFVLYRIGERSTPTPLRELGVPANAIFRLADAIRRYAYSLPELLDYVYFRTTPMLHARPRDILSFASCARVVYKNDLRSIRLETPSAKQMARMRELIGAIRQRNIGTDRNHLLPNPTVDEHYLAALSIGDVENSEDVGPILASLKFPEQDGDDSS